MGRIIRYRFFLFAGIFPYLLGQVIAYDTKISFNFKNFWLGLIGIFLVLIGVELFNEYFDFKSGGDRVFSKEEFYIPDYFFLIGIGTFLIAFLIGLYLTFQVGWLILLFSFLGFLGAYFYVGPPIRWAYKGFGEAVIGICYGPCMLLGSYYLQVKKIDFIPFFVSLICGLAIFCLALINEIPDYYQDRLVGKRNLVVRLGRERALKLLRFSLFILYLLLSFGIVFHKIPLFTLIVFISLPFVLKSLFILFKNYENPNMFIMAVNTIITTYFLIIFSLSVGYLMQWKKN
ncbi:MAG: prenyltransferase [Candidatus Omnitrophica bacterium]|nr:prenyltransferase [Candidatus Omnitrophota bacterium]